MHSLRLLFITLLIIGGFVFPVSAQDDTIRIDFPPAIYVVSGKVDVHGTVNPPNLQNYFLEVAAYDPRVAEDAVRWLPASLPSRAPVTDGVLATWDTTRHTNGLYQLRLRVTLQGGAVEMVTIAPIRVAQEFDAQAGAVVIPTEAPPQAPDEPLIVPRPDVVNELPLPVGGQLANFSDEAAEHMKSACMTWVKWQIPFIIGDDSLINVARDRINWSHEHGFKVLLTLLGTKEEMAATGLQEYYPLFADFAGRIAALQPDAIEVWNEMNLDREWPNGQIDPRSYVEMLKQAHQAIKAVDPEVMVVTGAPAPTGAEGAYGLAAVWNDDRYMLGMANAGAADYADCIGVHYNEGIIPPQQQGGDPRDNYPTRYYPLMLQRVAFPFRNNPKPICFTELGYLSGEGFDTPLPSGFAWAQNTSVAEQALWLRDAITLGAESPTVDIDMLIIFNMNYDHFGDDPQAGYAIIRPDGSCPACEAIGTLRNSG